MLYLFVLANQNPPFSPPCPSLSSASITATPHPKLICNLEAFTPLETSPIAPFAGNSQIPLLCFQSLAHSSAIRGEGGHTPLFPKWNVTPAIPACPSTNVTCVTSPRDPGHRTRSRMRWTLKLSGGAT